MTGTSGILITGGLGDIGSAVGARLARDGHAVTLTDLASEPDGTARLDAIARGDATVRDRLRYAQADVTDRASLARAIGAVPDLSIVIANAGIVRSAPFLGISRDDWDEQLAINLTGAFLTAQVAASRFVAEGGPGLVLFTGSWVGSVPWPEIGAYTVSKAGLEMLAKQLARELAPQGIRANVIAPGIVMAGMARHQFETEPQYAARATRVIPLKAFETVEQVAGAFSFACSPDAEYMTGSTLLVDGGASLFAFD
jgi:NAD(P)-dependent dehydrogenase (short-subunit alcohol dehydrogenase family)